MKTTVKKIYEAMFLVDSTEAATDWEGITGLITNILQRADAEVVTLKKWDDRKLAYAIGSKDRGTYILCYFKAPGAKVGEIERDVQLSERIMRVLILSAEGMSKEDMEKETPAGIAEKQGRKAAEAMEKPADSAGSPQAEEAANLASATRQGEACRSLEHLAETSVDLGKTAAGDIKQSGGPEQN